MIRWDGPLFYPPVGKIAVMDSGSRIEVWPDESSPGCFTGLLLKDGRTHAQRVVCDLSCMWGRSFISHIEEPASGDLTIMEFPPEEFRTQP